MAIAEFREEVAKACFAISSIYTLRGKATLDQKEKLYNQCNAIIDEKIRELARLFATVRLHKATDKGVS